MNYFKKCEKEWRRLIPGKGDPHHVLPKSVYPHFRHEPMNGVRLSREAHSSAHLLPELFIEWLRVHHPKKYQWYLDNRDDKKYRKLDYEVIYKRLKEME